MTWADAVADRVAPATPVDLPGLLVDDAHARGLAAVRAIRVPGGHVMGRSAKPGAHTEAARRSGWPKQLPCLKCDRPREAQHPGDRFHPTCRPADAEGGRAALRL